MLWLLAIYWKEILAVIIAIVIFIIALSVGGSRGWSATMLIVGGLLLAGAGGMVAHKALTGKLQQSARNVMAAAAPTASGPGYALPAEARAPEAMGAADAPMGLPAPPGMSA